MHGFDFQIHAIFDIHSCINQAPPNAEEFFEFDGHLTKQRWFGSALLFLRGPSLFSWGGRFDGFRGCAACVIGELRILVSRSFCGAGVSDWPGEPRAAAPERVPVVKRERFKRRVFSQPL